MATTTAERKMATKTKLSAQGGTQDRGSLDLQAHIKALDKAHLNGTAKVVGDLVASKLVVSEGAAFKGHLHVGPDAVKAGAGPRPQQPQQPPKGQQDQGKK